MLNKEVRKILQNKAVRNPLPTESIVSESGFIMPVQGSVVQDPGTEAINIIASEGQPVKAVKDGIVTFASDDMAGNGKSIIIKHSDGFLSFYAYNSEILVKLNQAVKQGEIIAKVGKTGRATSPQLHFRLFKNDAPVNPLNYLP